MDDKGSNAAPGHKSPRVGPVSGRFRHKPFQLRQTLPPPGPAPSGVPPGADPFQHLPHKRAGRDTGPHQIPPRQRKDRPRTGQQIGPQRVP